MMKKAILAIATIISANTYAQAAEVYVRERPPFGDAGTVYKGIFYYFTNARGEKCDLYLGGGCYVKSNQRATAVGNGIIRVAGEYYCSRIPDTSRRTGYTYGYGKCTPNGWIPRKDP